MNRWLIRLFATALGLSALALRAAPPANLPPDLVAVRSQVVAICRANTLRVDNIPAVRAQLDPLVARLAAWFNTNRPPNEVALTQRPWKSLWYDDPTIDEASNGSFGGTVYGLNRDAIYQVVEDGYYYNVSEVVIQKGRRTTKLQNFLKGAYTLANRPDAGNAGQPKLNVVDLEFVYNGARQGGLPAGLDLRRLVRAVETRRYAVSRVPGPIGITGQLWNAYIDDDLRISLGEQDDEPGVTDLYILEVSPRVVPGPA